MKLYEIEDAILECVDTETGDIIDIDRLEQLEMERDKKISNIACFIKDLRANSTAIKDEVKNLQGRAKVLDNKADSLEEFLARYLNGTKFSDARCAISYRASVKTVVADDAVEKLADEYKNTTVTVKPDLKAIKAALESGVELEGCSLLNCNNIQIK